MCLGMFKQLKRFVIIHQYKCGLNLLKREHILVQGTLKHVSVTKTTYNYAIFYPYLYTKVFDKYAASIFRVEVKRVGMFMHFPVPRSR